MENPAQPPVPAPQPPAPPAPPAPAPPAPSGLPQYEGGGGVQPPAAVEPKKGNAITRFFGDVDLVQCGILALGTAAFFYSVFYYKFEMALGKTGYADLNARVGRLESAEEAAKKAKANANGRRPVAQRRMR